MSVAVPFASCVLSRFVSRANPVFLFVLWYSSRIGGRRRLVTRICRWPLQPGAGCARRKRRAVARSGADHDDGRVVAHHCRVGRPLRCSSGTRPQWSRQSCACGAHNVNWRLPKTWLNLRRRSSRHHSRAGRFDGRRQRSTNARRHAAVMASRAELADASRYVAAAELECRAGLKRATSPTAAFAAVDDRR